MVKLTPASNSVATNSSAMKRFIQLGSLLPNRDDFDPAARGANTNWCSMEMAEVRAEIDAMMQFEMKLRDLQP